MRHIFATAAILAISAGPALAQEIPAGQSCGGLFCDLGIFGHKTAPAATPSAPPAPPAVRSEAVPEAAAEPRRRIVHRKRAAPETATAAAPPVAKTTPVAATVAAPVAPAAAKRAPTPPTNEPVIFVSPASQAPGAVLKDMFQPIYR